MAKKLFISYRHTQAPWVWQDLTPCLEAAGADVLIDQATFQAGQAVVGQMDQLQDQADLHLLVITDDYLQSKYCLHEMQRALNSDPQFKAGKVIPIRRDGAAWPPVFTPAPPKSQPLYVDFSKPRDPTAWALLLRTAAHRCRQPMSVASPVDASMAAPTRTTWVHV